MGERRSGSRVSSKDLPEALKKFKVDLGTGELLISTTVDANERGISLLVPIHIYKVKNYDITLYSMDNTIKITDEIVYVKGTTPEESRISIMFSSSSSGLEKYRELLESAI